MPEADTQRLLAALEAISESLSIVAANVEAIANQLSEVIDVSHRPDEPFVPDRVD